MSGDQTPRKTELAAASAAEAAGETLSHNLLGQRLGRKGRDTRERILAAAERLLADPDGPAISLSAVAREASLAMTSLYLYFTDLSELILAVLNRTMISAEEAYVVHLRERWPDEVLSERCQKFVSAYFRFWSRHARVLHLRNSHFEPGDARLQKHRLETFASLIEMLVEQMDGDPSDRLSPAYGMATALLTGTERIIFLATDETFRSRSVKADAQAHALVTAQARLFELGVRDGRSAAHGADAR